MFGMNESKMEKGKVDTIINRISESEGVGWNEARRMLHKYVCEGKCDWYKTKSKVAGFDRRDLTKRQKRVIEGLVKEAMKDSDIEESKWRIHRVLCPGHPGPRPKK